MPRTPFLQPTSRVTSTRRKHHLRRPAPTAVGKPASARRLDRPRQRRFRPPGTTPDHLAVIRPPTAARLTARRRLRADRLLTFMHMAWGEGERRCFIGWRQPRRIAPSDTSRSGWSQDAGASLFQPIEPVPTGARQCADVPEPEVPSTGEDHASALARARRGALPALADGGSRRTCSSDVRRHRLDLSFTRFRVGPRGRVRSCGFCRINVSTSTTVDLSNTPATESAAGATALCSTGSPRSRAITEWARGQGSRNNRSSTLPAATARHADFAPTPTVSGASCRGHRSFTLSGVTRGESGTAIARALARLRERQGRATPGFREEVRRSPARGTFHPEVVRERTKAPAGQTS
jgi:hypothetical protein